MRKAGTLMTITLMLTLNTETFIIFAGVKTCTFTQHEI